MLVKVRFLIVWLELNRRLSPVKLVRHATDVIGKVEYKKHQFWLVDTAGLKDPNDDFEATIQDQITESF